MDIEPHESMFLYSHLTDKHLQFIEYLYGPTVKDRLLYHGPVPIRGVKHANRISVRVKKFYRSTWDSLGRYLRHLRHISQRKTKLPAGQTRQGA